MAESKTKTKRTGSTTGFTAEEKAAMRERARETKSGGKADGESGVLEKIAEMGDADRDMAERIHALVADVAPELSPKTWYGMPAYAKDGKVLCFFQAAGKFDSRYATFGFTDEAQLDQGAMWPTYWGLTELTAAEEKKIVALVKKAVR